MSHGYIGVAKLFHKNDHTVTYEYFASNLNIPEYTNQNQNFDGTIMIDSSALIEPEMYTRLKKMPKRRKKMILCNEPKAINIDELFNKKQIQVINSQYCWRKTNGDIDMIAIKLICKILYSYQSNGHLPDVVVYQV